MNEKDFFGEVPSGGFDDIYQGYSDTCAIRSQEIILRDFGINLSQDELIQMAQDNGWYTAGGGTPMADVGNLLELNGIPVTHNDGGNVFQLVSELSQGHKVIVGVDSKELWGNNGIWDDIKEYFGYESPDHAVIVSGIDTSDPNNIKVVLTDPGTGDVAKSYSLEEFMNAWSDSNCHYVATESPVPDLPNFDYGLGHIDDLFGFSFEDFQSAFAPVLDLGCQPEVIEFAVQTALESVTGADLSPDTVHNALLGFQEAFINYQETGAVDFGSLAGHLGATLSDAAIDLLANAFEIPPDDAHDMIESAISLASDTDSFDDSLAFDDGSDFDCDT